MRLLKVMVAMGVAGLAIACVSLLGARHAVVVQTPRPALASVLIEGVPHERQQPDFCGEAATSMWLRKLGQQDNQNWVFAQSGTDPQLGRGAYAAELSQALSRIGFHIGSGWYPIRGGRPDTGDQVAQQFAALHADLQRQVPSIVCMHYDDDLESPEHFRLILGYDAARDEVIYHEPAEDNGSYRRMPRAQFLSLWPLKSDESDWTVVRFRLDGSPTAAPPPSNERTAADYAQHILKLKKKLPKEFTIVLEPPFVVVGNDDPVVVRKYAEGSVAWAVKRLKEAYFTKDPDEIIDIWLFKDDDSYRHYTKTLFDETPETPYGYYTSTHNALFMNISTGGGTLVHEIVHPYLHANFPQAPAWLQEGLGSLYEQCDDLDGKIVGLTNWRLEGLQERIHDGKLPRFRELLAASSNDFYKGRHRGSGYGQSRYLLYYLQQRDLLGEYYKRFYQGRLQDPTGYRTLQSILGEQDMIDFQRRWERWVMQLEFHEG